MIQWFNSSLFFVDEDVLIHHNTTHDFLGPKITWTVKLWLHNKNNHNDNTFDALPLTCKQTLVVYEIQKQFTKYFNSSCDIQEYIGTLQVFVDWSYHSQVITLLKHPTFSCKMCFCISFIMALHWKFHHAPLCQVFTNWVTHYFSGNTLILSNNAVTLNGDCFIKYCLYKWKSLMEII